MHKLNFIKLDITINELGRYGDGYGSPVGPRKGMNTERQSLSVRFKLVDILFATTSYLSNKYMLKSIALR